MTCSSRFLLLLCLLVGLSGCRTLETHTGPPVSSLSQTPALAPPSRAPDGLLQDTLLQAVVEAQVRRRDSVLVGFLQHPRADVRARAAFALGSVQAPAARDALVRALSDDAEPVRADAAFALGQLGDSTAADALLDALQSDPSQRVRSEALDALGLVGDAPSLVRIASVELPEPLEPGRALAIARYGVRGVHSPIALNRMLQGLAGGDPAVQVAAAYYFGRVGQTDPWGHRADEVRAAAASLAQSPEGGAALQHLVRGLARLQDPTDVPLLTGLVANAADWRVRVNAARALAGYRVPEAAHALLAALDDPQPLVAITAATSLAALDLDPDIEARAAEWVEVHRERWRVVGPLLGLVSPSRPGLAAAMLRVYRDSTDSAPVPEAERSFAQAEVIGTLAGEPGEGALAALEDAAGRGDSRVRAAAVEALKQRWAADRSDPARFFAAFRDALTSRDVGAVYAAAPVLADSAFDAMGASELLQATYTDLPLPEFLEARQAIVQAMGAVRDTNAVSFLVDVVLEGHPTLRQAAADALNGRLSEGITVSPTGEATEPTTPGLDWERLAAWGPFPRVELRTPRGRVVLQFDALQAPQTVQTILDFVERGTYDGVPFHRVVPNFVVQGGDYVRGDGFGGPDFNIRSEFTRLRYARGVVGMASAGKDTEGSQWFITHAMQPHLDGRYTAFGRVVEGMEVVDRLLVGDPILRARVLRPGRR